MHFVRSPGRVRLFVIPWTAARQAFLSCTVSQSLLKLMSIESAMQFNPLILCFLFYFGLQAFLASGSFPASQIFSAGGQSAAASASASILPMNTQGSFRIDWVDFLAVQGHLGATRKIYLPISQSQT